MPATESTPSRGHLTRRNFLAGASVTTAVVLLEACSVPNPATPTPLPRNQVPAASSTESYDLVEINGQLIDPKLNNTNHPFLEGLGFYYVSDNRGTLKMLLKFRQASEFRIASRELQPNPGWFYNKTSVEKAGWRDPAFSPVLRFGMRDQEQIHLGFKLPIPTDRCIMTYTSMRVYLLYWGQNEKLVGRFEGLKTLNPDDQTFVPRDDEAKQNWNSSCLT